MAVRVHALALVHALNCIIAAAYRRSVAHYNEPPGGQRVTGKVFTVTECGDLTTWLMHEHASETFFACLIVCLALVVIVLRLFQDRVDERNARLEIARLQAPAVKRAARATSRASASSNDSPP